jgi:hypothetical protein
METGSAYFHRKRQELALIARSVSPPLRVPKPSTIEGVIEAKFHLAAQLRSQHALHSWHNTETCWQTSAPLRAGPFEFDYRYQRADLAISQGPLPYGSPERLAGAEIEQVTYTCSGMAAISAVLLAASAAPVGGTLFYKPGCYKETLEFTTLMPGLQLFELDGSNKRCDRTHGKRILWLDCPAAGEPDSLQTGADRIDLIVFDTTCFSAYSGRIRRVVTWARRAKTPIILVRSHTKLDSLGIEYGRLGSIVFLTFPDLPELRAAKLRELARKVRDVVRLLGNAALPAHFCPFVAGSEYAELYIRRNATLLRNNRLTARILVRELGPSALRSYSHGLFSALVPPCAWTEGDAIAAAEDIAANLARQKLSVRHAGSFGFDFTAVEAYFDTYIGGHVLRIAMADLPSVTCACVADAITTWWIRRWRLRAA